MIDEKKLIEDLKEYAHLSEGDSVDTIKVIIKIVGEQPKVGEWIPCSEILPKDYVIGKKEHLTNGIYDWNFHVREKVATLIKADIDLHNMSERLKKYKPYSPLIEIIDELIME